MLIAPPSSKFHQLIAAPFAVTVHGVITVHGNVHALMANNEWGLNV
ncbi:hypothetical protein SLEP1_g15193 [Rubroshorea leprosula]|uniref:Uncharacterized protein n=1 Tax=Rubroshorea leprosula TaxID=152421 RepID=A0AAV5IVL8_9ROSI|nr:hypothetical protein SLEP1_g15193 [Rubroshorea leprosula]